MQNGLRGGIHSIELTLISLALIIGKVDPDPNHPPPHGAEVLVL